VTTAALFRPIVYRSRLDQHRDPRRRVDRSPWSQWQGPRRWRSVHCLCWKIPCA